MDSNKLHGLGFLDFVFVYLTKVSLVLKVMFLWSTFYNCDYSYRWYNHHKQWHLKYLGNLSLLPRIEVHRTLDQLDLSQTKNINDLLGKARLNLAKSLSSPISCTLTLSKYKTTSLTNPTMFQSILGTLHHYTITRHQLAFMVEKHCQIFAVSSDIHWLALKRVLMYLKGTLEHWVFL